MRGDFVGDGKEMRVDGACIVEKGAYNCLEFGGLGG